MLVYTLIGCFDVRSTQSNKFYFLHFNVCFRALEKIKYKSKGENSVTIKASGRN